LGKEKLARRLRDADFRIEVHDAHFNPTEDDPVWLLQCGEEGWTVITPDVQIKNELKSLEAILAGQTRVFLLSTSSIKSEKWAEVLTGCRAKLLRIIRKTPGPFICRITSENRIWGMKKVTKEMIEEKMRRAYEKRGGKKE
jgi:hypothetical protein